MPSDVLLEGETATVKGLEVIVESPVLKAKCAALDLSTSGSRKGPSPTRRALVHSNDDSLHLNEGGDYPAGVAVKGPHLSVQQLRVVNPQAKGDTGAPGGRALTQSVDNALVINEGKFYTGGVEIEGDVEIDGDVGMDENVGIKGGVEIKGAVEIKKGVEIEGDVDIKGGVKIKGLAQIDKAQFRGPQSLIVLLPALSFTGQQKPPVEFNVVQEIADLHGEIAKLKQQIAELKKK